MGVAFTALRGGRPVRPGGSLVSCDFHVGGGACVLRELGLGGQPWGVVSVWDISRRLMVARASAHHESTIAPESSERFESLGVGDQGVRRRLDVLAGARPESWCLYCRLVSEFPPRVQGPLSPAARSVLVAAYQEVGRGTITTRQIMGLGVTSNPRAHLRELKSKGYMRRVSQGLWRVTQEAYQ